MYRYSKAIALKRSIGAQWLPVDLSHELVFQIYNDYTRVVLELTNPALSDPVFVDMDTFKQQYSIYEGTIEDMLQEIGDNTLPTVPEFPSSTVKYCKYSDAFRAGYKVRLCNAGRFYPDDYDRSSLQDVAIARPNYPTDMSLIHDYCLVTVNGMLHLTDTDNQFCYVYGAGATLHKSKQNHIGFLSFLDVGKITKMPFTDNMIFLQDESSSLNERMYINVPGDLTGKTVLLSLGGYLMFPNEPGFKQTNDNIFSINFNEIPFVERVIESSNYIDLSSLGLDTDETLPNTINVQQLLSDTVLKRYLKLSQSFLIIVDTPTLFTNRLSIRNSNHPGMFTCYQNPESPLMTGYGKFVEYWKVQEDGHWAINVSDSFYRNFAFYGKPMDQLQNVNDSVLPFVTTFHSKAHFLEIGTYK